MQQQLVCIIFLQSIVNSYFLISFALNYQTVFKKDLTQSKNYNNLCRAFHLNYLQSEVI
jgi:hypothetical protein